jgi:glycosyltransferase involved in cell wall biosynthesis
MEPVEKGRTHVLVLTDDISLFQRMENLITDLLGEGAECFWVTGDDAERYVERWRKTIVKYSATFDVFVFLTEVDFQEEYFQLLKAPDAFVLDLK